MPVHSIVSFQYGETPLHQAARRNHPETVYVLLQGGADVNCKNDVRIIQPWFLYIVGIVREVSIP